MSRRLPAWVCAAKVGIIFGCKVNGGQNGAILNDPSDTRCKGISTTFSATTANAACLQWQQSTDAAFTTTTNLANSSLYSGTTTNTLNIVPIMEHWAACIFGWLLTVRAAPIPVRQPCFL